MVHEPHEVLRRAEPRGGGKVAGTLVAPRIVQRMLRHRQQLHGGVAHILHIGRQLLRQIPVVQEVAVFVLFPGAEMHLVDVQRPVVYRLLPLSEGSVRPWKMLNVIELAGRAGAGLRVEPVGVRLVAHPAVLPGNGVFVAGIGRQIRQEALPELPLGRKGRGGGIPAVEIPYHGDRRGMGCPDAEPPAVDAVLRGGMGAEKPPAVRQTAAVIQLCPVCHRPSCPLPFPINSSRFPDVERIILNRLRQGSRCTFYLYLILYRRGRGASRRKPVENREGDLCEFS